GQPKFPGFRIPESNGKRIPPRHLPVALRSFGPAGSGSVESTGSDTGVGGRRSRGVGGESSARGTSAGMDGDSAVDETAAPDSQAAGQTETLHASGRRTRIP